MTQLETEPIFGIHIEFSNGSKPMDYYNLNLKQATVVLQNWSEEWILIPEDCKLNGEMWNWHANARSRKKTKKAQDEEEESNDVPSMEELDALGYPFDETVLGVASLFTEPAE